MDGLEKEEIITEMTWWFLGTPLTMIQAHRATDNPKEALKNIWAELGRIFATTAESVEQKLEEILKSGQISKDDAKAHCKLYAELNLKYNEAKREAIEHEFDRIDIVRKVIDAKLIYMVDKFWEEIIETNPDSGMKSVKFSSLIQAVCRRS